MSSDSKVVTTCASCGKRNRVPVAAGGTPRCGACRQPVPWIVDGGDADFRDVADRARVPVLVDLWAPWCPPCRVLAPAVEAVARDLAGRLKVVKVNVDEAPQVARRFGAMSIPTLVLLRGGQEADRRVGALSEADLRDWLEPRLASVA